jgi:hypothetical protein
MINFAASSFGRTVAPTGGGGGGGNPELLPNTDFSSSASVTTGGGAGITGGMLDLGAAQYGFGQEGFTRSITAGEVLRLTLALARLGDCQLRAQLGFSGNAAVYGDVPVTGSGNYAFTITDTAAGVPMILTFYNNAAGSTSPQVDAASLKLAP